LLVSVSFMRRSADLKRGKNFAKEILRNDSLKAELGLD